MIIIIFHVNFLKSIKVREVELIVHFSIINIGDIISMGEDNTKIVSNNSLNVFSIQCQLPHPQLSDLINFNNSALKSIKLIHYRLLIPPVHQDIPNLLYRPLCLSMV